MGEVTVSREKNNTLPPPSSCWTSWVEVPFTDGGSRRPGILVAGGEVLSDRAPLLSQTSCFYPSTQSFFTPGSLTYSNSPWTGASEIGIEDRLRRERRANLKSGSVGFPPQKPGGEEAPVPRQGTLSCHSFFPPCQASFFRPVSWQLGLTQSSLMQGPWESHKVPQLPLVLAWIPEVQVVPKRTAAFKCSPYLARCSHGSVVTLGFPSNVRFHTTVRQGEEPYGGGSHEPIRKLQAAEELWLWPKRTHLQFVGGVLCSWCSQVWQHDLA
jgi:hypothetical protein